ncbi:hypothetical protein MJI37_32525, partial [Salmonella enterica subsp. enterica serovar Cerro]|nr:hypothetical protein [Salmonella enterica subsp. enterica serovar Cerro]
MGQRIPVTLGNIAPLSLTPFRPGRMALVCEGGGQRRKIQFNRRESRQTTYFAATFCASGIWHQLLFWLMPPSGDVYP